MKKIKVLLMTVLAVSMLLGMNMTAYADRKDVITISGPSTVECAEKIVLKVQITDWDRIEEGTSGQATVCKNGGDPMSVSIIVSCTKTSANLGTSTSHISRKNG